jgi:hypothetical protein
MQRTRYLTPRAVGWLAAVGALTLFSCSSTEDAEDNSNGVVDDEYSPRGDGLYDPSGPPANQGDAEVSLGAPDLAADTCPGMNVRISRVKPRIIFAIDRSGSMSESFNGSTSRWDALRTTLMDADKGVIARLQSVALFGMVMYDGPLPKPWGTGNTCPHLVPTDAKINNYKTLENAFPKECPDLYGSSTPTAAALDLAYEILSKPGNEVAGQGFVVLCTDGQPNQCVDSTDTVQLIVSSNGSVDLEPDFEAPIKSVSEGAALNIKTYIVNLVNGGEQVLEEHFAALADLGGTGSPVFTPTTQDELAARLQKIVEGALGCKVMLNVEVAAEQECSGSVELNGRVLKCDDPNGWMVVEGNYIELRGEACSSYMTNPTAILHASFPCQAATLIK